MENNLIVTTSPHLKHPTTTRSIMRDVLIALTPAYIAAIVIHKWYAALIILVTVASAVLSEFLFCLITKKKQTVGDLSAAVTGLLLALNISTKVPLWQCAVGAVFAIIVVKCLFGGIGCNFANPAITARIFMLLAFSKTVANGALGESSWHWATEGIDAGATPLIGIKQRFPEFISGIPESSSTQIEEIPTLLDMFLGKHGGAIGEGCALALIIGGIYLIVRRVIKWQVPVAFIGTVFVLSLLLSLNFDIALYSVLSGGVMLGGIFMVTDYSTTPLNTLGKVVFAIGAGVITVLIRCFGDYPEGISFGILIMNILSPYIEKITMRRPFGGMKKNEK